MTLPLKSALPVVLALATAVGVTFTVITPALAQLKQGMDTHANCVNAKTLKGKELRVDADPDTGLVNVGYTDESGQPKEIVLNYKSNDNFAGCSDGAKRLLSDIKVEAEKHDADLCTDMKEILKGNRPLPVKGEIKPTMEDVKKYIEKKGCK